MKKTKFEEIKKNNLAQLIKRKQELLDDKVKEIAKISSSGRKKSPKIKEIKKEIAQIETAINQKLIQTIENEKRSEK